MTADVSQRYVQKEETRKESHSEEWVWKRPQQEKKAMAVFVPADYPQLRHGRTPVRIHSNYVSYAKLIFLAQ